VIQLHRDADRQISRQKSLAFTGHRAGDHDQVGILDRRRALAGRIVQQRTLEDTQFIAKLGAYAVGRNDAVGSQYQHVEIDTP